MTTASELLAGLPPELRLHHKCVLAVSGGADSVAMMLAMSETCEANNLIVAHYNHRWRGSESDGDEQFVVELAQELGLHAVTRNSLARLSDPKPQTPANQNDSAAAPTFHSNAPNPNDSLACVDHATLAKGISGEKAFDSESIMSEEAGKDLRSEAVARSLRYEFLKQVAYSVGATCVLTAHTRDDRVETILHNLFRGTGLAGLVPLPASRSLDSDLTLIRPLIHSSREEVLAFLGARSQSFRTDSSNNNTRYRRNYLRQVLLPAIHEAYPAADAHIEEFSSILAECLSDVQELAQQWLERQSIACQNERTRTASGAWPWPTGQYWVAKLHSINEQPWTIIHQALRQVWLSRNWSQQAMSRARWLALQTTWLEALRHEKNIPPNPLEKPKSLLVLPGDLSVEIWADYIAIGKPDAGSR